MTAICPCCGNEMNVPSGIVFRVESHTLISSDFSVTFGANQARLFDLLWKSRNTGAVVSNEKMIDYLYGHDADGGPDSDIIKVMINQMRRKLARTGIEIISVYGEGYFLRMKNASAAPRISARELARAQANCG